MRRGKNHVAAKAHFCRHLGPQLSKQGARHFRCFREQGLRNFGHAQDFRVPAAHGRIQQRAGGSDGVLVGHFPGQQVVKIIRRKQQAMGLLQPFLRLGHQLIDRVERLLRDAGFPVEHFVRQLVQHRLGTIIPIGDPIGKHPPVFVYQHIIHAPGINAHGGGNNAQFSAFFHACQNVLPERAVIPAQMAVFLLRAVGKTVNFLQRQFPVFDLSQHVPPAGRADVDGQNRSIHSIPLLC